MASAPTVSVIIPTYNRADLISQSIDSVLQQTFTDYEIIVVDDESTDNTEAIVKKYGDRVRYVWTPNGGTGHARNVGMQHARGRYLTFLDSDDILYPYALELETKLLERFPGVSMVCAEVTGFDDHGFIERSHMKNYHKSSYRDPAITYDSIFPSSIPLRDTGAVPASVFQEDPTVLDRRAYFGNIFDAYIVRIVLFQNTAMIRREVVDEIGPRNEQVFCYEELDYLVRLSRRHDVLFADVPTYKLRYHQGQVSTQVRRDGRFVWARKQRVLLRVMKRHILADPAYYERRKQRLDRHLAELHRSVAVPMLSIGDGDDAERRYERRFARYARLYLLRCRQYGHPEHLLYIASFMPGAIRRTIVTLVEIVRVDGVSGVAGRVRAAVLKRLPVLSPRKTVAS